MRPTGRPEILLKRADEKDVAPLLRMLRLFAEESGEADAAAAVTDAVLLSKAIRHMTVYLTYYYDEPTGFVMGMDSLGGRGSATPELPGYYLSDLYVLPDWRQLGLGKALLSAMLQTPTSWGETRFLRWEMATGPEATPSRAFYDSVLPERHSGTPYVWEAPPDRATVSPERYMAFRPRRLMTEKAWLSLEPAFATQGGRWFARLHELAGVPGDYPQLLDAVASDGFSHLSMAEGLDLPEGQAERLLKGCYRLEDAEACLVVFPPKEK